MTEVIARRRRFGEHLEQARQRVAEMGDPRNDQSSPKAKQAQARARRGTAGSGWRVRWKSCRSGKRRKSGEKAKRETRVSTSDPQARVMKHPDKGFALSYNAQISTDAAHRADCGSGCDTGGQRHGPVIASGGPRWNSDWSSLNRWGGRQRIHHAREYREDGWTRGRFSGGLCDTGTCRVEPT